MQRGEWTYKCFLYLGISLQISFQSLLGRPFLYRQPLHPLNRCSCQVWGAGAIATRWVGEKGENEEEKPAHFLYPISSSHLTPNLPRASKNSLLNLFLHLLRSIWKFEGFLGLNRSSIPASFGVFPPFL